MKKDSLISIQVKFKSEKGDSYLAEHYSGSTNIHLYGFEKDKFDFAEIELKISQMTSGWGRSYIRAKTKDISQVINCISVISEKDDIIYNPSNHQAELYSQILLRTPLFPNFMKKYTEKYREYFKDVKKTKIYKKQKK